MNPTNPVDDPVNHPAHYTSDPSGVECITITRHRNFNIGNAIKYLWRAGLKDNAPVTQDLRKAIWYIEDEISRLKDVNTVQSGVRGAGCGPTAERHCRICKKVIAFGQRFYLDKNLETSVCAACNDIEEEKKQSASPSERDVCGRCHTLHAEPLVTIAVGKTGQLRVCNFCLLKTDVILGRCS